MTARQAQVEYDRWARALAISLAEALRGNDMAECFFFARWLNAVDANLFSENWWAGERNF